MSTSSPHLRTAPIFGTVVFMLAICSTALASTIYWGDTVDRKIKSTEVGSDTINDIVDAHAYSIQVDRFGEKLYWIDWPDPNNNEIVIQRANLDGSNVELLIRPNSRPLDLALDIDGGKVYWSDTSSIWRANLDGSNEERLLGMANRRIFAITIDSVNDKLYFIQANVIKRATIDGFDEETLVDRNPHSLQGDIALDVKNSKMYWTESAFPAGEDSVYRANFDGSIVERVITMTLITDIALDLSAGKIYTAPEASSKIHVANLDGTNLAEFIDINSALIPLAILSPEPVLCAGVTATLVGTQGDDVIDGSSDDDVIAGLGGDDSINGRGGNDILCGGDGSDVLRGGGGDDDLWGGRDPDELRGGGGSDNLHGDRGDDTLFGGWGDDDLYGDRGDDELRGGAGDDNIQGGREADVLRGGSGNDHLLGGTDNDECFGGWGTDSASACESVRGVP